jgi:hypothetical protein
MLLAQHLLIRISRKFSEICVGKEVFHAMSNGSEFCNYLILICAG